MITHGAQGMLKYKLEVYEFIVYAGAIATLLGILAFMGFEHAISVSMGQTLVLLTLLGCIPLFSTIMRINESRAKTSDYKPSRSPEMRYAWQCIWRFVCAIRIAAATSVMLVILLLFLPIAITQEAPEMKQVIWRAAMIVLPMTWPFIVSVRMLMEKEPIEKSPAGC